MFSIIRWEIWMASLINILTTRMTHLNLCPISVRSRELSTTRERPSRLTRVPSRSDRLPLLTRTSYLELIAKTFAQLTRSPHTISAQSAHRPTDFLFKKKQKNSYIVFSILSTFSSSQYVLLF
jgi:hypothetical protein